jgi:hypothetical protein
MAVHVTHPFSGLARHSLTKPNRKIAYNLHGSASNKLTEFHSNWMSGLARHKVRSDQTNTHTHKQIYSFLARPSFIIRYDSNKKRYKGRAIVFASVSSVGLSVPIEGLIQTWSTYIYIHIKLKVFLPGTRKWWCKFFPENKKPKNQRNCFFWGIFVTFSHTDEP